jgi:hypothetical protein
MNTVFSYGLASQRQALPARAGCGGKKPPDAESAVWGRDPESVGDSPHLSGARGVGRVFAILNVVKDVFFADHITFSLNEKDKNPKKISKFCYIYQTRGRR